MIGSPNSNTELSLVRGYRRWRLAVLLGLMGVEVLLIVSLRQRGWIATTDSTQWILTVIAAFLPLVIAAMIFVKSWRRLRLRTLFFCIASICVFLSVSLSPLVAVRNARRAARALSNNGVELLPLSPSDSLDNSQSYNPRRKFPPAKDIPSWLLPLTRDLETTPQDQHVVGVTLRDDEQIEVFIEQLPSLENLRCINLTGEITDQGIKRLLSAKGRLANVSAMSVFTPNSTRDGIRELQELLGLRWLLLSRMKIPEDGWFDQFARLQTLHIWDEEQFADPKWVTTRWSQENMDAVAKLEQLKYLQLTGLDLNGIDFRGLARLPELQAFGARCHNVDVAQLQMIQDQIAARSTNDP